LSTPGGVQDVHALLGIVTTLTAGLDQVARESASPELALSAAANLAASLSRALGDLAKLVPPSRAAGGGDRERLQELSHALSLSSEFLTHAANRDWVGIALGISFELGTTVAGKGGPELTNGMSFLRMLMAVYQAKTTDEAKAIFSAQLERKSSRRERFSVLAVDVSALVGVRGGWQQDVEAGSQAWAKPKGMGGLHVPVGIQLTNGHVGAMIYALDLGSYLVARPDTAKVQPYDAIRPGVALMWRLSARYPIDFFASGDFRPAIGEQTKQLRYGGGLCLELPLYLIR
jgi:hypothetical protein